jgi:hypothetical protein
MAIAVGIRACEENYRVAFRTAAALVNEMIEARKDNRLSIYIKPFKGADQSSPMCLTSSLLPQSSEEACDA